MFFHGLSRLCSFFFILFFLCTLTGCKQKNPTILYVGISPDYPPFECYKNGKLTGFDVELAEYLGQEMGKKIVFEPMDFGAIFLALQGGTIDLAISSIMATPLRQKTFSFSQPYHTIGFGLIYLHLKANLKQAKFIAQCKHKPGHFTLLKEIFICPLGTTMQEWCKKNIPKHLILCVDNALLIAQALKSKRADFGVVESDQAMALCEKNPEFSWTFLHKSDHGFCVAMRKGSPYTEKINKALHDLEKKGIVEKLKKKWLKTLDIREKKYDNGSC